MRYESDEIFPKPMTFAETANKYTVCGFPEQGAKCMLHFDCKINELFAADYYRGNFSKASVCNDHLATEYNILSYWYTY